MNKEEISTEVQRYIKPLSFEKFIFSLFENLGYHVSYQVKSEDNFSDMELIHTKNGIDEKYVCEIKYYSKLYFSPGTAAFGVMGLSNILKAEEKGLFITNCICTDELRERAVEHNIIILDLTNLLYLLEPNKELYQAFLSLLDFSVEKIQHKKPIMEIQVETIKQNDEKLVINWNDKLKSIEPGTKDFPKYEKICIEILKLLFPDYLTIWEEQKKSNGDLYRFDLICKIKNDVNDDFFSMINRYFNTRYIVFDFKNYTDEITQKEIYTTEKYLYDKALRKVAIIISRKGIDSNALQAIKGSIREQGKVILSLTDDDLLQMIQMYNEGDNPTSYLSMKLDNLLIELEK